MKNDRKLVEQQINEPNDVSVYAYDYALVTDLRARFKKTDSNIDSEVNDTIQIGPADDMFDIVGQLNDDKPILPFVSLQRLNWQLGLDRQGYQTFIGDKIGTYIDDEQLPTDLRVQSIPITINYQLSVWTADRLTNDAIMRELLFYYHLRPTLLVYIGHGINMAHSFNIYFNSDIEDNSDISNHNNNGRLFRQDITLYTDDAYLWKANHQPLVEITPDLYFHYGNSAENSPIISSTHIDIPTKYRK